MLSAPRDIGPIMSTSTDLPARLTALLDAPDMPGSVNDQLRPLVDALEGSDAEQLRAWSELDLLGLVDPRSIADEVVDGDRRLGSYEQVRAALIFAPIAVTWLGIGLAARAYGRLPSGVERYENASFIALWEQGFDGHGGFSLSLFHIGLIDFLLIACVIALTAACNGRRRTLEAASHRRAVALRTVLTEVQRDLVDHRQHGALRFRRELTSAAGQLRSLSSDAADSGKATRDALGEVVSVVASIAMAAESQHRAVGDLGEEVVTLRAAVERLADLHGDAMSAAAQHAARLDVVADTASEVTRQAADAGSALEVGSRTLASALGRIDKILDSATEGLTAMSQTIAEHHAAQDQLVAGMQQASTRLGSIGPSAAALESAVTDVAAVITSLETAMSSVASSVPASMVDAADGLRSASRGLEGSAVVHNEVVTNVRATAASLEVSLAQVREDLVGLHDLLVYLRKAMEAFADKVPVPDGTVSS